MGGRGSGSRMNSGGGRGSGSNMSGGGRGASSAISEGGSARSQYDAAEADRARLAAIRPSERTPEQHQQLTDAINRQTDAAYRMISEMSDSQIQRAADNYIKDSVERPTSTDTVMRQWIRSISNTKKDGSPTKTALENAKNESWGVINSTKGLGLSTSAYSDMDHSAETERIGRAIVKSASKYRNRFG